jgi:F0F1-type ATP synthase membrane subunit a
MFSLAIRLTANIFAGHTLVNIVASLVVNILNYSFFCSIPAILLLAALLILELGVAFLQAYVFTILLAIYLKDSLIVGHA